MTAFALMVEAVRVELMAMVFAVMVLPVSVENVRVVIFIVEAVNVEFTVSVLAVMVLPTRVE